MGCQPRCSYSETLVGMILAWPNFVQGRPRVRDELGCVHRPQYLGDLDEQNRKSFEMRQVAESCGRSYHVAMAEDSIAKGWSSVPHLVFFRYDDRAAARRRVASWYTDGGSGPFNTAPTFSFRCAGLSVPTMVVCTSGLERFNRRKCPSPLLQRRRSLPLARTGAPSKGSYGR